MQDQGQSAKEFTLKVLGQSLRHHEGIVTVFLQNHSENLGIPEFSEFFRFFED
jgi:hypothetical protein